VFDVDFLASGRTTTLGLGDRERPAQLDMMMKSDGHAGTESPPETSSVRLLCAQKTSDTGILRNLDASAINY